MTSKEIEAFLKNIKDEGQREDSRALVELMHKATKTEPKLWPGNMVGFGDLHYKYESGREGETFMVGFSPRKQAITIYGLGLNLIDGQAELLKQLGKHKTGKGCLYVNHLRDVHLPTLRKLVEQAFRTKKKTGYIQE